MKTKLKTFNFINILILVNKEDKLGSGLIINRPTQFSNNAKLINIIY